MAKYAEGQAGKMDCVEPIIDRDNESVILRQVWMLLRTQPSRFLLISAVLNA
jgi:hypothetical protein